MVRVLPVLALLALVATRAMGDATVGIYSDSGCQTTVTNQGTVVESVGVQSACTPLTTENDGVARAVIITCNADGSATFNSFDNSAGGDDCKQTEFGPFTIQGQTCTPLTDTNNTPYVFVNCPVDSSSSSSTADASSSSTGDASSSSSSTGIVSSSSSSSGAFVSNSSSSSTGAPAGGNATTSSGASASSTGDIEGSTAGGNGQGGAASTIAASTLLVAALAVVARA